MDPTPSAPLGERLRASRTTRVVEASQRRRRVLLRLLLAIAVVGGILALAPLYRSTARWRAESLISQADELIRQQSFSEAIARLENAGRMDPANAGVLRRLADIYRRFELPAALPVLRALANSSDRTDEDLQNYIDIALKLQRFDLVDDELSRLLARTDVSIRTRILATEYFFRLGDLPRALAFANDIRRIDPTNTINHLRAAKILLTLPEPERRSEGYNLLRSLTNLSPTERVQILEILNSTPGLGRAQIQGILEAIPEPASPASLEYFLRASLQVRLDPATREKVITGAIRRFRGGTPEFQTDLCTWLLIIGEHERIIATYPPDEAARIPGVLTNYLHALARGGRWSELQKTVATSPPLDPWLLGAFHAIASLRLNQAAVAEEHWRRAFESAAGTPVRLRAIGDIAITYDDFDTAIKAFTLLSENKLHRGTAYRRLAQVHERRRDPEALRSVMQAWAAGSDNPYAEQAYCYLSALLGKDVESALPRARRLVEAMPNRLPYRATLAFLELRRGEIKAASLLFERAAINPASATPQSRLVEALVLEANGNAQRAQEIAASVKADGLLPQEQEILRRLAGNVAPPRGG